MNRYSVSVMPAGMRCGRPAMCCAAGRPIEIGRLRFTAIATPGHTPGGISYYCLDRVFTGDALFCGSVGGTDTAAAARLRSNRFVKTSSRCPTGR